jgi:hypothetical protein
MGALHRCHPWVVASLLGACLVACSMVLQFDADRLREDNAERCSDGVDNDDNGLTDCAEPDCAIFDFCAELSAEACRDRVDNNRNGLIDCQDPGCLSYAQCTEQPDGQCTDGLDNNADGLVDCQDFTCGKEPHCCNLVVSLQEAPLVSAPQGCTPNPCDPDQTGSSCAAFDSRHWVSIGAPAPAVAPGGGFDPNRCDDCYLQGDCASCADAVLLSARTFPYRSGLAVGAQLHQASGQHVRAGVALTWQTSFDVDSLCTGDAPLDRVAGVELTRDASGGSRLTFLVDGVVEAERSWPTDTVAAFIRVDPEGFAGFYLRDALGDLLDWDVVPEHRSDRALPVSTAPIRLALYGGGAGLRVSEAGVWDTARCFNPVPSRVDTSPEFFPDGVALSTGDLGDWDSAMVESPTVVTFRGEQHLYYTGRDDAQGGPGAIGHAVLAADGTWDRGDGTAPPLRTEDLIFVPRGDWPSSSVEVYGPSAVVLPSGDRLALYYTVAWRDGDSIVATGIGGAVSEDGVVFEPMESEAPDSFVLAPVLDAPDCDPEEYDCDLWERAVRDPAVVWREVDGGVQYTMVYTGRSDPENPFTAQIGLATSADGNHWTRGNVADDNCFAGLCNQPVVSPPADALVHTAVSDPTLVWDPLLEVFRLWYVWRVGQQFSIFHAVAGADARTWVVYPGNPVLRSGDRDWCDDLYLDGPSATLDAAGQLRFWYHGFSDTHGHSICYADNTIEH